MEKQYPKDYFKLVQESDRLLDKPLQTKRLTYFQDAMVRFTKNKYNVIATIVLATMILMSIFVPILMPKNYYENTSATLQTLAPRVPILEKIGIFDGMEQITNQSVDYSTIDPETGLGYPTELYDVKYIQMDTLENQIIYGSERDPKYVGGTNDIYIQGDKSAFSIITNDYFTFAPRTYLQIDVNSIDSTGVLEVYLAPFNIASLYDSWDDLTYMETITDSGVHKVDPKRDVGVNASGFIVLKYVLPEKSKTGDEYVSLNSISVINDDKEVVDEMYWDGYELSTFSLFSLDPATEDGSYVRNNAAYTTCSFVYDKYSALFADKLSIIGRNTYNEILSENPGMEESIIPDPDHPDTAWTFDGDFPLKGVVGIESKDIGGTVYYNYRVLVDGKEALGFTKVPYFLFGTDVFGKDLFTLIWLGLRTSLLLGFLASIVNIIVGIVWGATSAYYGGQTDILMERFTDIWGSFPQITMIGIITVLIGPGFLALFIYVVYDGWIGAAKITRSQFYRYKRREYVLAARTLGASDGRIIFKHILPNALGTIVTRVILGIPSIIFLEVNLSYLGFGIGNGQSLTLGPITLTGTSIGVILNDGKQQIFAGKLWLILFPTLIVSILMITFNMFGNALRDALNPQLRGN